MTEDGLKPNHQHDERSREEPAAVDGDHERDERSREEPAAVDGDHERDERSCEEPAAARAQRACGIDEVDLRIDDRPERSERSTRRPAPGGSIRVGTSGWVYPPWRGVFYPPKLAHRAELEYLASKLNSVEINGTFYSLQRPESFRRWHAQTPPDFTFAVKAPRFITHMKKLADVEIPLANFFASGVLALDDKLGPFLWQLPPTLGFDADRLAAFFAQLPRSTGEAAWLARRHDERMKDRAVTTTDADRPIRHAMEVRHPSFAVPAFTDVLREHAVAAVLADTAGRYPMIRAVTADFAYLRLHGDVELYASGYTDAALDTWTTEIRTRAAAGLDVQVHFDNDVKVRAPFDAMGLLDRLDLARPPTGSGV